ncbi:MAG TPA: hypothetical protein VFX03_05975 [Thermomicrobiales bacterium]|nr:hypothetical protein [Thermomicrobiales bacterium]
MQFDMQLAREGFVAREVCPVIDVAEASGNVGIIPVEQLLSSPETRRAPRADYNRTTFTFEPDTYATQEHGIEELVDEKESRMYANYFKAEMVAAMRVYRIIQQALEIEVAALYNNTAVFTNTAAAAAKWDVKATADPAGDIETACQAVFAASGMWPNVAIIPKQAFRRAIRTDAITGLIKYAGISDPRPENISPQALAQAMNIEKIVVPGQAKNTADEGQVASLASVWDKTKVFVGRICDPDSEDFREVTAARIVHWAGDGSSMDVTMESYPDLRSRAEVIRGRQQRQVKTMYAAVGYIISAVL